MIFLTALVQVKVTTVSWQGPIVSLHVSPVRVEEVSLGHPHEEEQGHVVGGVGEQVHRLDHNLVVKTSDEQNIPRQTT